MNREQLLALEAFSSGSYLVVNKTLITIFGLQEAVFLSNLIDKFRYFSEKNMLQKDNGFFLTHEEQEKQTSLSLYQLRKCKKNIIKQKILKTYVKGVPSKEFYILDFDQLINIIEKSNLRPRSLKTKDLGPPETKDLYKENKYKENKRKENIKRKEKTSSSENINVQRKRKKERPSVTTIKAIVSEWNKIAAVCDIPKVQKLTSDRISKFRTRCKSFDLYFVNDWKEVFSHIKDSSFLCGDNNRGWTITFDWLINSDKNLSKLIEDNFKDKKKKKIVGLHKEESWDDYEPDFTIDD